MKKIKLLLVSLCSVSLLSASQLHIKADSFSADQNKGLSIFKGDVNIVKNNDELNASKVMVYTDKQNKPTKFVALGNVSFVVETQQKTTYRGKAQKVIYLPKQKEYHFFKDVHLRQTNETKEIIGNEVVLNTIEGKAYAKGAKAEPVIMIFDIDEKK